MLQCQSLVSTGYFQGNMLEVICCLYSQRAGSLSGLDRARETKIEDAIELGKGKERESMLRSPSPGKREILLTER